MFMKKICFPNYLQNQQGSSCATYPLQHQESERVLHFLCLGWPELLEENQIHPPPPEGKQMETYFLQDKKESALLMSGANFSWATQTQIKTWLCVWETRTEGNY